MYSTCTFCHATLGANEALEAFPVGRRLAFDQAKGRLWVICEACKQWNLSPLEERWEAIEAAEKLYRDTRLRVATDHVGLARVRDGTELIRIGEPLRPEFAAWRYGERFTLRFRRYAVQSTILIGGGLAIMGGGWLAGLGLTSLPLNAYGLLRGRTAGHRVLARFEDDEGPIVFTENQIRGGRIIAAPEDAHGWRLALPHRRADLAIGKFGPSTDGYEPRITFGGSDAVEIARRVLPQVNLSGARRVHVDRAVRTLEDAGTLDATFLHATKVRVDPNLGTLPIDIRLALEMAVHEDIERRALAGELATLETAWKEAEEIANIADSLTLPEWVAQRLARISTA